MNATDKIPLLLLLGTMTLIGAAAYVLINSQFDEEDFKFDTYDEHTEDYF